MASLNTRGGTTIKNRILSGGGETEKCAFSVMAYETENPGTYKAFVEDGEVNYTSFYAKNKPPGAEGAEIVIKPNCEIALMLQFKSNGYEYKQITDIFIVSYDVESGNSREEYATQVVQNGDFYDITLYIPLAYAYMDTSTDPATIQVRQYFCGNINFKMYYSVVNGALCYEFFQTVGIGPGEIPESTSSTP
jgi:hypothetical protein